MEDFQFPQLIATGGLDAAPASTLFQLAVEQEEEPSWTTFVKAIMKC